MSALTRQRELYADRACPNLLLIQGASPHLI